MIIMRYGIFTVGEEYFEALPAPPRVDVLRYRLLKSADHLIEAEAQSTVTIDLTQATSDIFRKFGKDNQYKIRRAEAKDAVSCRLLRAQEITEPFLAELESHYRDLVKTKGITPINMQRIRLLKQQGQLYLGKADAPDGTALAWHVYQAAHGRARLLYSVSLFRESQEPARRALVGRANRLLHWNDIVELKDAGLGLYDLGGYYLGKTDESKLRINQFKDEFHGELRTEYNGFQFQGPKGLLARAGLQTLGLFARVFARRGTPQV